ncbi:glycerophosphodiester phosphodiesterase [Segetibacter sp. 3557_3]|uniref:glycerophosphodiester phosphodiesterase family protein n=1 Tax=Segetibacter sp. 3557_3 TaxID=2547429 RepID=UPI00105862B5|nr:glycerophosphodiester phosphodiesterase family protein [Segetibacter sp. 3557_3]TDH28667.1 glycerophosphodiester phosphodiesterase [Segetibacter sp. 3557_3]
MKNLIRTLLIAAVINTGCTSQKPVGSLTTGGKFDFEAHRGGRGLMPENTIIAMKNSVDLDVTTLELDVVISRDNKVVVSHDAHFNDIITTTPDGKHLTKQEAEELLLYRMDYDSIRKYDVGIKPHPGFPQQQKIAAYKPLLSELIDSVEAYAKSNGKSMSYNIEIKSRAGFDGTRHPAPPEFSELLIAVLNSKKIIDRTIVQSFDVRPLQYIHQSHPSIKLSYLVENTTVPFSEQMSKLGFTPTAYSPNYPMLTKEVVDECHRKNMQVIPWTVNTVNEMNSLVDMGVDGIISDYPNLFKQLQVNK